MKDENKKKQKALPEGEQKKKVKKKIDPKQRQEQEELFSQADSISPANKKLDEKEFVELRDGRLIDLDEYILKNYVGKSTHFFKTFYNLIADLLGVSRDTMIPFVKTFTVPMLKRLLIYGRFPNAVQQKLYKKNPYSGYYKRKYYNYQWLTLKADLELRGFIDDFEKGAEKVVAANGNLKMFIVEYCQQYDLPIQLDAFDLQ